MSSDEPWKPLNQSTDSCRIVMFLTRITQMYLKFLDHNLFFFCSGVAIAMGEQGLGEWVSKMLPPLYKELSAAGDVMSR